MRQSNIVNVTFLLIVNSTSMITGIFLNTVVIISLWSSSQLRKKVCYFMILILSCFDLAVVAIAHPLFISSAIDMFLGEMNEKFESTKTNITSVLQGLSLSVLFTLTVERFLALIYPFFHHERVTKARLAFLLAFLMVFTSAVAQLYEMGPIPLGRILGISYLSCFMVLLVFMNGKLFILAKSKQAMATIAPNNSATSQSDQKNRRLLCHKRIPTCFIVVVCFFVCFSPYMLYCVVFLKTEVSLYNRQVWLWKIWAGTFGSLNSTLNCAIFFWRNSILRREGKNILKCIMNADS